MYTIVVISPLGEESLTEVYYSEDEATERLDDFGPEFDAYVVELVPA